MLPCLIYFKFVSYKLIAAPSMADIIDEELRHTLTLYCYEHLTNLIDLICTYTTSLGILYISYVK